MLTILWNSRAAMNAQQQKLDSISNNLANVDTEGYKKTDVGFQDLVYENLNRTGYPLSADAKYDRQNGTGVKTTGLSRNFGQGPLKETGINTDLAIDGDGFFKVKLQDGSIAYTRDGSFVPTVDGGLATSDGYKLVIDDLNPNFQFKPNNFSVNDSGEITTLVDGNAVKVGKITLANVDRQNSTANVGDALVSVGNNLYKPVQGVAMKDVTGTGTGISQGFIEGSNVNISQEITDMIITQRAFELNSKALKTADDMWNMVNNLRGR